MADELFLNRYRITGELGRGAMGTIHRAEDTLLGREVALKMITAAQLTDENRSPAAQRGARRSQTQSSKYRRRL